MITPAFDLSQDPEYLTLSVRVPYTRTSEFDLYIDGTDIKFYAKPYFLRLTLPGRVVEDGREKATFDIDKGLFTVQIPKEIAGEHFEGLQMLTSLLAPRGSRSAKPLLEDISPDCSESAGHAEAEDEEEFDWQVEQEVYVERSEEELSGLQKYGFGNKRAGVFARLQEELSDVIDVKNPDSTTKAERRQARLVAEASAFSPDHYLADLFEDDEIKRLLKFRPWWTNLCSSPEQEEELVTPFSDEEKEQLRKFNNQSYLLDKTSRYQAWLSLVDVILAYCYEVRSTEGEHNVESPWTIRKLSGTLCWLETYSSLQEVLVSFGRRVLCYPLYRHFAMAAAAVSDAAKVLRSGKACILKCLLDIHKVFRQNDPAYILNDLYITDYCIWIQKIKSKKLSALATALQKISLQKKDLDLDIEELEEAAAMVAEEDEESSSASDDSSTSEEDDECEAEERACAKSRGGGGESSKDGPLQPQRDSSVCTSVPQEGAATALSTESSVHILPQAPEGVQPLIQELGELRIAQESHGGPEAERKPSQQSIASSGGSSGAILLECNPGRNPFLVIPEREDPHSPDFIS
ncbi:protein SHQ1 homolog [Syngnathus scovelli]|uniref:protein SHQ1 homolog n=1 Tax=Syngnathus scovelli TaxID=161590 RepID=UPI00210F5C00|nr:protein SHQ1 homolog [Syngnathus scovelli]